MQSNEGSQASVHVWKGVQREVHRGKTSTQTLLKWIVSKNN